MEFCSLVFSLCQIYEHTVGGVGDRGFLSLSEGVKGDTVMTAPGPVESLNARERHAVALNTHTHKHAHILHEQTHGINTHILYTNKHTSPLNCPINYKSPESEVMVGSQ